MAIKFRTRTPQDSVDLRPPEAPPEPTPATTGVSADGPHHHDRPQAAVANVEALYNDHRKRRCLTEPPV